MAQGSIKIDVDVLGLPQVEQMRDELSSLRVECDSLRERKDGAYEERNRCVSLLTHMAVAMGLTAGLRRSAPIPGWDAEWHNCVYIDLPVGQVSWHYHDSQASLFADLPEYTGEYDGHTTAEKYLRATRAFRLWPR